MGSAEVSASEAVDYTLGAIAVILAGGIIVSLVCARRRPDSRHMEIPARRELGQ
jgi:hypothetical protein